MNNVKRFAALLNGRERDEEITTSEELEAHDLGLVVVYGFSDDNAELVGAIEDEVGCYDGGTIYLNKDGVFGENDCDCKWFKAARGKCRTIKAIWHDEGGPCWTYETDIPHATFDIMEDGEVFCRGIVFDIKSLEETQ